MSSQFYYDAVDLDDDARTFSQKFRDRFEFILRWLVGRPRCFICLDENRSKRLHRDVNGEVLVFQRTPCYDAIGWELTELCLIHGWKFDCFRIVSTFRQDTMTMVNLVQPVELLWN